MSPPVIHSESREPAAIKPALPTLLVFADDWGRHPSSCQHLVRRLRRHFNVLWVNTIGTRRLRLDLFTVRRAWEKFRSWGQGLSEVNEEMSVIDLPMLPWMGSWFTRTVNRAIMTKNLRRRLKQLNLQQPIVLTTLPHVSLLLGDIGQVATIYYCTDDYGQWPSANQKAMAYAERITLQRADLVLAVSRHLVSRCQTAKCCELFPHAVDFDHFARSATAIPHPEILKIPGPRIGFFGLIYEKLDFELLTAVATRFKNASIVLIGPEVYCPDAFKELPNVHLVGPKSYAELPEWIAGLDVLMLPYVMDEMIRQSNPLKLRECLATGKPTVSVEVPESRDFEPHVRVATTRDDFLQAIHASLAEEADAPECQARQLRVQSQTWDRRANQLIEYLRTAVPESF